MHSLIIGMTESGKSTLATILARELHKSGKRVAVLDPMANPAWEADFITDDIDDFCNYLREHRSVYAFVDESGHYFNDGNNTDYSWLATRSRHYGHSVFFISQRATQIPKTMRDQCSRLYLFTSSVGDGKIHADEWNKEQLTGCNTLERLHFYRVSRYDLCDYLHIRDYAVVERVPNGGRSRYNRKRGSAHRSSDNNLERGKVDTGTGNER